MNSRQMTGVKMASLRGPDGEEWCLLYDVALRLKRPLEEVWRRYKALEENNHGLSPWSSDLTTIERSEPDVLEPGIYVHKWWAQTAIWLDGIGIERVEYRGMRQTTKESPYRGRLIRAMKFVPKPTGLSHLHAVETKRRTRTRWRP